MATSNLTSIHDTFQTFLDSAVEGGAAPGLQCIVFDGSSILFNGASGLATLPSPSHPSGVPYTPSTISWLASCTKISMSLIILHIITRNLCQTGFTFDDLDDPEKLAEVLPEFSVWSGSLTTKIIEGFGEVGEDGKRMMKLRDAKERVTLRHLLTHTAGMAASWGHPLMKELVRPSDGSIPNFGSSLVSGDTRDFEIPLVGEPGLMWCYGQATDWLGQFAIRATNKTLRQLFNEIIWEPLSIPTSEADIFFPNPTPSTHASMSMRVSSSPSSAFQPSSFKIYIPEGGGEPAPGKTYHASGCVFASCQAYAKVLQAVLRKDEKILSKDVWERAMKDDLKDRKAPVQLPKEAWKSSMPHLSNDVGVFAESTSLDGGAGINLLQCCIATAPTKSGRPTGSFGWAGLANSYYFVDPVNNIGAIMTTQLLPFFDKGVVKARDQLEALVYKTFLA
ncbi:hypothetical protein JAAARDRAFT_60578 [Jaapia argillacea MUCL 33604]|uniref:Beta-lactamase-related domain-containing protein n=1 Tax=Jaapia argillacea MUCL 33604 TaxID=933084 RepID=A0A067PI60_9AGAM|nr:hypothetical protein JAAARDRAFT_60578 [Jaapia argillacea MUCL 33604]